MTRSLLSSLTILVASLAVLSAGVAGVIGELSPYFTAGANADQRITALASYAYRPGASTTSKSLILDDCHAVTNSLLGLAQPTERRDALVTACIDYATAFVTESPVNSRGWLTSAEMAANLDDADAFNRGLAMSRLTGPASNWLADDRLQLSRKRIGWLDADNQAGLAADIRLLMLSDSGVRFLAELYDGDPEFREQITSVVETVDEARQQRFLQIYARTSGAVQ
jgi:hypothetical protein